MNLRKNKQKEFHELPSWLSYYIKDTCDPSYGGVYILSIDESCIYEIVVYKTTGNSYYMGVFPFQKKNKELSVPIIRLDESISKGLFIKLSDRIDVNSAISKLVDNFNSEFSITMMTVHLFTLMYFSRFSVTNRTKCSMEF